VGLILPALREQVVGDFDLDFQYGEGIDPGDLLAETQNGQVAGLQRTVNDQRDYAPPLLFCGRHFLEHIRALICARREQHHQTIAIADCLEDLGRVRDPRLHVPWRDTTAKACCLERSKQLVGFFTAVYGRVTDEDVPHDARSWDAGSRQATTHVLVFILTPGWPADCTRAPGAGTDLWSAGPLHLVFAVLRRGGLQTEPPQKLSNNLPE
jgi:hypothetical protein